MLSILRERLNRIEKFMNEFEDLNWEGYFDDVEAEENIETMESAISETYEIARIELQKMEDKMFKELKQNKPKTKTKRKKKNKLQEVI